MRCCALYGDYRTALPLLLQTAWRLSSYVAVSYCNASSIAGWNCTRCDGIAAGVQPEEVRKQGRLLGMLAKLGVDARCIEHCGGCAAGRGVVV